MNYWNKDDEIRILSWVEARAEDKTTRDDDRYVWSQCRKLALGVARKIKSYPGCIDDLDDLADEVASHLVVEVLPVFDPKKGAMYSYLTASAGHYISYLWRRRLGEYVHHCTRKIPEMYRIDDQVGLATDDSPDADLISEVTGFVDWCQVHALDLANGYDIDKMTICYLLPTAMTRADSADQPQTYSRRVLSELARRSGLSQDVVVAHVRSLLEEYMGE